MDTTKVKAFIGASVNFGALGYLNIENQKLIEFYKECLIVAQCFDDDPTILRLYLHLGYVNGHLGCLEDAMLNYEECLNVAKKLGDKIMMFEAFSQLGHIYKLSDKSSEAIECFKKSLNISIDICDRERMKRAHSILGYVYCDLGKYEEAIAHHDSSINITLEICDNEETIDTCNKLAECYQSMGQYYQTIKYSKKGLEIAIEAGDGAKEQLAHACIGDAYSSLGDYKEAIACYKKVLEIGLESKMSKGKFYEKLSSWCEDLEKYDEAVEYSQKWLEVSQETGQERNVAIAYFRLGKAYRHKFKYEESLKFSEECLNVAQTICDMEVEMAANFQFGDVYREIVQPEKAIGYYEKSLKIAETIDSKYTEGCICLNLGIVYKIVGQLQKATYYYNKSLDIFKDIDNKEGEADCYVNLGTVFKILGEYKKALAYHKKSLDIFIEYGNKQRERTAYMSIGCVEWALGNHLEANTYFEKALKVSKETDSKEGLLELYETIACFYESVGQITKAIEIVEKSRKIAQEVGNKNGENNANKNLVAFYLRVSKFQEAKTCLENLDLELIANDKVEAQSFYYDLGATYKRMGKPEDAINNLRKSLDIAIEIGKKEAQGLTYLVLGDTLSLTEEFDDAIQYCESSLSIAKKLNDLRIEASAYSTLGSVYHRRSIYHDKKNDEEKRHDDKELSIQFLKKALECWDLVYGKLEEKDDFQISIVDTYKATYDELATVLIEDQQIEEALLVCDQSKARVLGDRLVKKYDLIPKAGPERSVKLQIDEVETLLMENDFCIVQFAFYEELVAWIMSRKEQQLSIQFNKIALTGDTQFLHGGKRVEKDINNICSEVVSKTYDKLLKVSEQMKCENRSLEFHESHHGTNDDGSCVVHQSLPVLSVARTSPGDEEASGDTSEDIDTLELLYTSLIAPILKATEQEEIVIIPDRRLFLVPFPALRDPNTKAFLFENKRIRLVPSLTTLRSINNCPSECHYKRGALIVGNPEVGEVMFKGEKKTFDRLENAMKEAKIVGANLDVEPLTGLHATKDMVKQKLKEGVAVIHIAAHGDSENGHILLAPSTRTELTIPEEQDYMLTMQEVQEIGVKAQLVVLSCCHSGLGEIRSEGVVGMSRAFLAAGARAVVASLWAIDDEVTLSFMVSFYTYLKQGERASKSLQLAMKEIREEGCDEPKYWAPFFLIGDDVMISEYKK